MKRPIIVQFVVLQAMLITACNTSQEITQPADPPVQVSPVASSSEAPVNTTTGAVPTPQPVNKPQTHYWVWVRDKTPDNERTYHLVEETNGVREIGRAKGVHVWVKGAPAELRRTETTSPKFSCNADDMSPVRVKGEVNRIYAILLLKAGIQQKLVGYSGDLKDKWDITHSIDILATVGPFAAIQNTQHSDGECAAHGSWVTTHQWFDMRTGSPLNMLERQPPTSRIQNTLLAKTLDGCIKCAMGSDSKEAQVTKEAREQAKEECEEPEIFAVEPLWGQDGFVRRYIARVGVPFVCSNDDSAYYFTSKFGAVLFSGEYARYGNVPRGVHAFVKKLGNAASLGGVYSVPATAQFASGI